MVDAFLLHDSGSGSSAWSPPGVRVDTGVATDASLYVDDATWSHVRGR
jgi:hypothetical protein